MNRGKLSVLADKDNISDSWKLLSAAAELLAALVGVDRQFEALLKFTKTVGDVGVKLIDPITSSGSPNADSGISDTPSKSPDRFNIEPLLSSLGISGISITSENLFNLLNGRYIETEKYSIHLWTDPWSDLPRRWHHGHVHLFEDAKLCLRQNESKGPVLELSFGHVRLGGEDRERTSVELAATGEAASSVELILSRQRHESEQVRIRLEYWPDAREILRKLGIRVIGRSLRTSTFNAVVSLLAHPESEFQCVLLLRDKPNA